MGAARVRPGELVLDLGAGEGALTAHLVAAGARVVAVELHPRRAGVLRERFPGITVLQADAVAVPLPGRPFRVVANPPYAGVNVLVRDLLRLRQLRSADLVVAEGAARGLQRRFPGTVSLGMPLPRTAFRHLPPAPARVVRIRA